jgi:pimeloyl-ACP methyl ester carboxylesterase
MEDVVLIPSLGRPASDFDLLSQSIRKSGYRAFANGNDASSSTDSWMQDLMRYRRKAITSTPQDDWWSASIQRVLAIQALQDAIAPIENGWRYKSESAPDARLVEIDRAGHAMLPEQPAAIASAVISFLQDGETVR